MFSVFCSLFYKRTFFMRTFLWEHFFLFSILENSEHFPKQRTFFSEMFSFFTENKISWEQLMKCSQKYFSLDCSLNLWLQKLPKTSKNFSRLPKTSLAANSVEFRLEFRLFDFWKCSQNFNFVLLENISKMFSCWGLVL